MYEFTLLKSMFFELDKYKIEGVYTDTRRTENISPAGSLL